MRDTHFCPICYATIEGRANFNQHLADHKNPAPVADVTATVAPVDPVPVTTEAPALKFTKDGLAALNKPEVVKIAQKFGIEKLNGKYLTACRVSDIEDAILLAQEGK